MGSHFIHPCLLTDTVNVDVIGAGGTGSQLVNNLVRLHLAMLALGHPGGLQVKLFDDDVVSEANVGRQSFYPCDVGSYKAATLINRINLAFDLNWSSTTERINEKSRLASQIVIGCVDNRKARMAIKNAAEKSCVNYWLDCGNEGMTAQCVLGEVDTQYAKERKLLRMPHAADLLPDLIDAKLDATDDFPSCSLAQALEKQSLFINATVALSAVNILNNLFRYGQISHHAIFVNAATGRTNPLPVDEVAWERFGYTKTLVKKRKRK